MSIETPHTNLLKTRVCPEDISVFCVCVCTLNELKFNRSCMLLWLKPIKDICSSKTSVCVWKTFSDKSHNRTSHQRYVMHHLLFEQQPSFGPVLSHIFSLTFITSACGLARFKSNGTHCTIWSCEPVLSQVNEKCLVKLKKVIISKYIYENYQCFLHRQQS